MAKWIDVNKLLHLVWIVVREVWSGNGQRSNDHEYKLAICVRKRDKSKSHHVQHEYNWKATNRNKKWKSYLCTLKPFAIWNCTQLFLFFLSHYSSLFPRFHTHEWIWALHSYSENIFQFHYYEMCVVCICVNALEHAHAHINVFCTVN